MVRLFSTVLRREPDGRHMLVTPVEKLEIDVEATAFRAVEMESEGEGEQRRIALRLDSGDAVILGPDHPLRLVPDEHGPSPRVLVRHGLEAELARPVYYELAEIALAEGHEPPGVWSDGAFFPLDADRNDAWPHRLRAALDAAARRAAAGRRRLRSRARRRRRPRCWSPSPTGPSPASS